MLEPVHEKRITCIVGTRPEVLKMAPVVFAMRAVGLHVQVVNSGQHGSLTQQALVNMGLEADNNLTLNREDPSLSHLNSELLRAISAHLTANPCAILMVHGDTATAFAAGLAGFYLGIPIAHVEAGLRSHNLKDPFPEEGFRRLLAGLAHWHFAPTARARHQLLSEKVRGQIYVTGNTCIDGLLNTDQALSQGTQQASPAIKALFQKHGKRNLLVTLHRRENWGAPLHSITKALYDWLQMHPDHQIVWPLHPNPELRKKILMQFRTLCDGDLPGNLQLIEPLDYTDMVWALQQVFAIATDSGGLQEEASAFQTPVLILRDATERPEAIEAGYASLVGCEYEPVLEALTLKARANTMDNADSGNTVKQPFGDGQASKRIATLLKHSLNVAGFACVSGALLLTNMNESQAQGNININQTTPARFSVAVSGGSASQGFQEGAGLTLKMAGSTGPIDTNAELIRQSRFNLQGTQAAVGLSAKLNDANRLLLSVNAGESRLFAKYGVQIGLAHTWKQAPNWVTQVGLSHQSLRDDREQNSLLLEQSWYTPFGVTLQAGQRYGVSKPGSVGFRTTHLAATGNVGKLQIFARRELAHEAYQAIDATAFIVDFKSNTSQLGLNFPVGKTDSISLQGTRYETPFYRRNVLQTQWGHTW
jgi:UDP-N-acetylglucosamine 2-epimerase (non-hydrolysing)